MEDHAWISLMISLARVQKDSWVKDAVKVSVTSWVKGVVKVSVTFRSLAVLDKSSQNARSNSKSFFNGKKT